MNYNRWIHRLALTVAGLAFVMITAGGMVTSMAAGDSVPDWPLSYNSVVPVTQIETIGGVVYEYGHRAIGWLLGILTISLAIALYKADKRRWVRRLGIAVLVLVCLQGALGGLRVLVVSNQSVQQFFMSSPTPEAVRDMRIGFAITHTALGQTLLGLICVVAAARSKSWMEGPAAEARADATSVRRACLFATGVLFVQVLLGALRRHTDGTIMWHMTGALVATIALIYLYIRVMLSCSQKREMTRPAGLLLLGLAVQLMLGFASWGLTNTAIEAGASTPQFMGSTLLGGAVLTTHLAIGALLLAGCVILTARSYRHVMLATEPQMEAAGVKGQVAPA